MIVNNRHYRTSWQEKNAKTVVMLDQNKLPFSFQLLKCKTPVETAKAIKDMNVRGAGAIGCVAGFAMAQAFAQAPQRENDLWAYAKKMASHIKTARPTAIDLFHAVDRVWAAAQNSSSPRKASLAEAQKISDENSDACKKIGETGSKLLKNNAVMQTHCNAGWLAFADWGSALAPVYAAKRQGKKLFVRVDETRPRNQGARLTAWELANEKIPHAIQADNAAASFMAQGKTDIVIVGADRISANGDFANKIGTMPLAVCAKNFSVPFYVAAPTSTIDPETKSGFGIPIEERPQEEVLHYWGLNSKGRLEKILLANPGSPASNPAFDVTPAKFVAGIITEKGIYKPSQIMKALK